jgi:hypothetical protein
MSSLAPEERELVIRIADDEEYYTCTSSSPTWNGRLIKIVKQLEGEGGVIYLDTGILRVQIPKDKVHLLRLRHTKKLSEEHRAKLRANMVKIQQETQSRLLESDTQKTEGIPEAGVKDNPLSHALDTLLRGSNG